MIIFAQGCFYTCHNARVIDVLVCAYPTQTIKVQQFNSLLTMTCLGQLTNHGDIASYLGDRENWNSIPIICPLVISVHPQCISNYIKHSLDYQSVFQREQQTTWKNRTRTIFCLKSILWSEVGRGGRKKSYHGKHQPQIYTKEVKSTLCMNCRWQIPNSDSVTHDIGNSAFDLILADKLTTELKINSGYGTSCNFLYFNWLHFSNINETECREFVYALGTLK